ncbi:aspartate/glutamate racemase family protein [Dactylosporangium sp. NBC_01737]|uniref:aspartate/glutamate racemase family protein n=1 Tax=Dactylosporangium sp. NBC_01737 TaxID=2975959 RepID=UPI002E103AC7|nr:aspartate/glutamate racemase family protein [Dactylosporangium sp. NBC_01737]
MLGVIGGVGPVATIEFYRLLVAEVEARTGSWPDLLVHSQPLPLRLVHAALAGTLAAAEHAEIDALLGTALDTLERAGCDLVAMPCNTFHRHLRPLLAGRHLKLIDMVNETIDAAAARGLHRLVLLATGTSVDHEAYAAARLRGIEILRPADQSHVVALVERCVGALHGPRDLDAAVRAAASAAGAVTNADGVLLGCTDLTVLRDGLSRVTPVVDSLTCLVAACADALTRA